MYKFYFWFIMSYTFYMGSYSKYEWTEAYYELWKTHCVSTKHLFFSLGQFISPAQSIVFRLYYVYCSLCCIKRFIFYHSSFDFVSVPLFWPTSDLRSTYSCLGSYWDCIHVNFPIEFLYYPPVSDKQFTFPLRIQYNLIYDEYQHPLSSRVGPPYSILLIITDFLTLCILCYKKSLYLQGLILHVITVS